MHELIVIGGGPAGLAAACSAWENGVKDIVIIERDRELGGILNQCIHNGFGLHYFKEELTGPEYASRFITMLRDTCVQVKTDTMVLDLTDDKKVHIVNSQDGYQVLEAKTVILAMGCRERTRGAISIPGTRPAGIFTAGAAQRYVNIEGHMVGKRVIILGSGDIGLIMARRLTLEGAEVLACVELMPYSSGLTRNIVQCLEDFDIPLYLSHTIVDIKGSTRVEQVTIAEVDAQRRPIPGTEIDFFCDTVLLSVGLIPENELSKKAGILLDPRTNGPIVYENMETSVQGIFACGNVVHVHDLVDNVTIESQKAGKAAAQLITRESPSAHASISSLSDQDAVIQLINGEGVTYTVPQRIRLSGVDNRLDVYFRVNRVFSESVICIHACGNEIARFKRASMAPGEMEHIGMPKALLAEISNNENQSLLVSIHSIN